MKCVVTFSTVHNVMKSEKVLKQKGFSVRLIPTPRKISSDCGMALEISSGNKDSNEILQLIKETGIPEPEGIHVI